MLTTLTHLPALWLAHTTLLLPLLLVAVLVGEPLAQITGIRRLRQATERFATRLSTKLDRAKRGPATRVYRGIVALCLLFLPVLVLGIVLLIHPNYTSPLTLLVAPAILGDLIATFSLLRAAQRARAQTLALELPHRDYLFADSHGVLRYLIASSAEQYVLLIGACVWFILGGLTGLIAYRLLSIAADRFQTPLFGWAARGIFCVADALPRVLSLALLTLAGLFTPRAHPFRALGTGSVMGMVATLLHITLGGPSPEGDAPWVGTGTAKILPDSLIRWVVLRSIALLLLVLLLGALLRLSV